MYNHVFKNLTPESCYWLGLIAADGNVCSGKNNNKYKFGFGLKLEDYYLVKQLQDFIGYNENQITINQKMKFCSFGISNKDLFEDLNNNGIIPRKSRLLNEQSIPNYHFSHYLRGVFDGDGSFGFYLNKERVWKKPRFSIYGHLDFLNGLSNKINKYCKIELAVVGNRPKIGVYQLSTGNREYIDILYNFMYKDKNFYMKRKFQLFEDWNEYKKNIDYTITNKYQLYINGRPHKEIICEQCGVKCIKRVDKNPRFCSRQCCGLYNRVKNANS